jgi:hypothetical protein
MATPKAPCPLCGKEIAIDSFYCKHCKQNLPRDAAGAPAFNVGEEVRAQLKGGWFCTQCGTVANPKKVTKGSFLIEVFMWLLFIFPGIIYSLWRLTSKYQACPQCKAANMIPVTSPVAQAALRQRA